MPLDTRQQNLPVTLNPKACFEDMAARFHPGVPLPDKKPCGKRFSLFDMRSWCATAASTPHGEALESSPKGLMIFDQPGSQSRLLQCPFPLRFPSHAAAEPVKLSELQHGVEEFDENCINGKESEMHEDTEEINALLYSDDDYDEDCESDDDEVMSTGHSPYQVEQVCNKRHLEGIDGPCKRQKLLDKVDGNMAESNISTKEDTVSGLSNEQSRKYNIRIALKILENIVPGAKGNQALLLLDEAIDYLKLLKQDLISPENAPPLTSH